MTATTFDFQKHLVEGCTRLGLELGPGAVTRLTLYFVELKRWSAKVNLIARGTTDLEIVDKHFLDSLALVPHLMEKDAHLFDVGSGAGFPGLVCKAAFPDLTVTLVEPRLKRVSFLRHVARTLALDKGVSVVAGRVEEVGPCAEHPYTHITSRAVTDLSTFLQLIDHLWLPGTRVLCMKGPKWSEELASCSEEMRSHLEKTVEYQLPVSGASRVLLSFKKNMGHDGS